LTAKVQHIIDIYHCFTLKGVKQHEFYEEMSNFASYNSTQTKCKILL
jgi:hypothetical protein